jgi:hypothetical protein
METLSVLSLVAAMNMMSPAHRDHFLREARESHAQADERYLEIATAIIDVSFDPAEKPIFGGQYARTKTAMFIAHKFFMESGFRRDVHTGIGRENLPTINDYGKSWCMGQLMLGKKRIDLGNGKWITDSASTTPEGWTGRELLADNRKCASATLHAIRRSISACNGLPFPERLAAYATGSCSSKIGQQISKNRYNSFRHWWSRAWVMHLRKTDTTIDTRATASAK